MAATDTALVPGARDRSSERAGGRPAPNPTSGMRGAQ
jgi:hypothetical protein